MTRARKPVGRITFVGAGPGDPGLLAVNAVAALRSADLVVADATVAAEVVELAAGPVQLAEGSPADVAKLLLA